MNLLTNIILIFTSICVFAQDFAIPGGDSVNKIKDQGSSTVASSFVGLEPQSRNALALIISGSSTDANTLKIFGRDARNRIQASIDAGVFSTGSSLLTSLVGYWKLDEVSGTRVDSSGNSNDLTDVNTVTQASGKVGNAGQFTQANSERLTKADNASLSMADIDFTVTCWVYADSLPGTSNGIVCKADPGLVACAYSINFNPTGNYIRFEVGSADNTFDTISATDFGAISTATWYFVCAQHDSVNNTISISINNGTVTSKAYSAGSYNDTSTFTIGSWSDPASSSNHWDGRIDEVGIWKRKLSASEITTLYNSGSGKTYPFS